MPCHLVVSEELASLHLTAVDAKNFQELRQTLEGPEATELRSAIESELGDVARDKLGSDDVEVQLTWTLGSLELVAVITCAKLVTEVGAFLAGLREIRSVFPQRIRDHLSTWLGRDVAVRNVQMQMRDGLLHGKTDEPSAKSSDAADQPLSVGELAWYAGLSLVVLLLTALAVIGGVALLV
jgi:hypothetical protein